MTEQAKAMVVHLAFDSQELVEASNIVAKGTRENEDSKQIWNRLQKIYWTNENETTAWNDLVEMKYSPGTDFHAHLEQARIKAIATGTPDRTQVAFISRTVPQGLRESMEADIRATEDPVEYVAKLKAKFERYPPLFENISSRLDVRSERPADCQGEGKPPNKTRFAAQQPAERFHLVEKTKMHAQPRLAGQMGWQHARQEIIPSPANPTGQSGAGLSRNKQSVSATPGRMAYCHKRSFLLYFHSPALPPLSPSKPFLFLQLVLALFYTRLPAPQRPARRVQPSE
ncbi:hypothetical protein FVE85_1236 [Porphyridium purpureum]|uniref:Uncharacterized protein n=1 Tax=Porphyridium purpureum TaxID=35688 RepID=A0A5J4YHA2_PORPP|nr:hypothetical protein FVE85_1236 [Porphyridium purpureum]|eukprot:POR7116..scf251_18